MGPHHSSTVTPSMYSAEYLHQEFIQEQLLEESQELTTHEGIVFKRKLAKILNLLTVGTWLLGVLLYFI